MKAKFTMNLKSEVRGKKYSWTPDSIYSCRDVYNDKSIEFYIQTGCSPVTYCHQDLEVLKKAWKISNPLGILNTPSNDQWNIKLIHRKHVRTTDENVDLILIPNRSCVLILLNPYSSTNGQHYIQPLTFHANIPRN